MNFGSSSEFGMKHKPWQEGEKRLNKFCFIGKNLDKDAMIAELKLCISDGKAPDPGPVPTFPLTYKLDDRVKCNVGEWMPGKLSRSGIGSRCGRRGATRPTR